MSLAGEAAIVIWNDVTPEAHADFLAWHNREHIPERVGVPGFHRGRRCRATASGPEFLTLYEVADMDVLTQGEYVGRLNSPSPWTQRVMPEFRNTARSLCRVEASVGGSVGGFVSSVRLPSEFRQEVEALNGFRRTIGESMRRSAELLGAHLLARDLASSGLDTAEKRSRTESVAMPATVLLVEATSESVAAQAAEDLVVALDRLGLARASGVETATYRHELCMTAAECNPLMPA